MAWKFNLLRKSWSALKRKLSPPRPTAEEDDVGYPIRFSPPTVVRLEESVHANSTDSTSSFTSSEESVPDYTPSPIGMHKSIYIQRSTSQLSVQPPTQARSLKSCIRRSASVPSMPPQRQQLSHSPSLCSSIRSSPESRLQRRLQISSDPSSGSSSTTKVCRFSEAVVVYETYGRDHYSRESVRDPDLTPKQIYKVNREVRRFKLSEMRVHPDSVNNTSIC